MVDLNSGNVDPDFEDPDLVGVDSDVEDSE